MYQPYTRETKNKWQIVETQGFHAGHDGSDRAPVLDRDSTEIPLIACEDGVKGFGIDIYGGLFCRLYTGKASSYLYVHLDRFVGNSNERVKAGDVIGYMGNTGKSTRTHLHFEVERNGRTINPNSAGLIYYSNNDMLQLKTGVNGRRKIQVLLEITASPTLTLRANPDTNSKVVGSLKKGQRVSVNIFDTGQSINGNNLWAKYGTVGWFSTRWAKEVTENSKVTDLEARLSRIKKRSESNVIDATI